MFEQEYLANHAWWEERAGFHPDTSFYQRQIQSLRDGEVSLQQLELSQVGEVVGKQLLHLQCHIGTDSLSWVRQGAVVTAVDFSTTAIVHARRLADELKLPATFLESDVYELPDRLTGQFDVVFTSYGAIIWLHDLARWAVNIARCLKPGGIFFIADSHPMLLTIDHNLPEDPQAVRLAHPYFESFEPLRFSETGSYADGDMPTTANITYEWTHSLSEILMSLIRAGLAIETFGEHPFCPWKALDCCRQGPDGLFRLPAALFRHMPLLFSLKARKPQLARTQVSIA